MTSSLVVVTRARSRLVQERVCGVVEVDTLLSSPRHSVVAIQIPGLASPALSTWSPGTQHSVGSAAG